MGGSALVRKVSTQAGIKVFSGRQAANSGMLGQCIRMEDLEMSVDIR